MLVGLRDAASHSSRVRTCKLAHAPTTRRYAIFDVDPLVDIVTGYLNAMARDAYHDTTVDAVAAAAAAVPADERG